MYAWLINTCSTKCFSIEPSTIFRISSGLLAGASLAINSTFTRSISSAEYPPYLGNILRTHGCNLHSNFVHNVLKSSQRATSRSHSSLQPPRQFGPSVHNPRSSLRAPRGRPFSSALVEAFLAHRLSALSKSPSVSTSAFFCVSQTTS